MPDTPSSDDLPDEPAVRVRQPGYDPDEAPGEAPGPGGPPDAVVDGDDHGHGPEERAPEPPDTATDESP